MGEKPKGLSLERRNNDIGYSKDNCCWATRKEQQNNRRNTIRIEVDGISRTLTEWASISGIAARTLYGQYCKGKPMVRLQDAVRHAVN